MVTAMAMSGSFRRLWPEPEIFLVARVERQMPRIATSVVYYGTMPGSRQAPDRSQQRARTREAVLNSAVGLLRQGRQPTVAEAAEAAGVHRATAYRYFPTPQSLLADAALTA